MLKMSALSGFRSWIRQSSAIIRNRSETAAFLYKDSHILRSFCILSRQFPAEACPVNGSSASLRKWCSSRSCPPWWWIWLRNGSETGGACRQNSPCLFSSIFTAGTEIRAVFYDGASLPDRRFHAGIFLEKFSENVLRALGAGYFAWTSFKYVSWGVGDNG